MKKQNLLHIIFFIGYICIVTGAAVQLFELSFAPYVFSIGVALVIIFRFLNKKSLFYTIQLFCEVRMTLLNVFAAGGNWFTTLLSYIRVQIVNISISDILDILILAALLYFAIRFMKKRRAEKLFLGIGVLIAIVAVSNFIGLFAVGYILSYLLQSGILAIIVIFQPEIRDALERIGNSTFLNPLSDTLPRKHLTLAKTTAEEITEELTRTAGAPMPLILRVGEPPRKDPQENLKNLLAFASKHENIEIK